MAKAPKTTTAPTGNIAPFGLRMLPELRAKIEDSAKESGRSMNAEIAARLEDSFKLTNSDALRAYVRHLQMEMAGMHAELAVFADEARVAARSLSDICDAIAKADRNPPPFVTEARKAADQVFRSAARYGADDEDRIAQLRKKFEQIAASDELYPHEFSSRSVYDWAAERAKDMRLIADPPDETKPKA
jgi:hypothetical protein